jgi:hypothetical protein
VQVAGVAPPRERVSGDLHRRWRVRVVLAARSVLDA